MQTTFIKQAILFLALILFLSACQATDQTSPVLIPMPQKMEYEKGWTKFDHVKIESGHGFAKEENIIAEYFAQLGVAVDDQVGKNGLLIRLQKEEVGNPHGFDGAYQLETGKEIEIKAPSPAGIFYGIQTLKQLVRKTDHGYEVANCEITDWPAFKIRGYMQDVGRNFQSVALLKEQFDVMATYKLNVFHMHFADNPGWRLESKNYPELQSEKATSRRPGKFYTQEEFLELLEYCEDRHITIIPELETPGHSIAFRNAFDLESMNDPKAQQIMLELIDEICALVPKEKMPFIHLGTDEVRKKEEKVDKSYLPPLLERIRSHGREVVGWWPGMDAQGDSTSIKQLWSGSAVPKPGHAFIDSRANYVNHLDPLAGIYRLFFQQPCRAPNGDHQRLGGTLCVWNDNRVEDGKQILRQNPVYPSIVTYSEAIWKGMETNREAYWSKLPNAGTKEHTDYLDFENRLARHRDQYFEDKAFAFVKNGHIPWKLIGPFDHKGDMKTTFPVEEVLNNSYEVDGETYTWWENPMHGGTIHIKHFFGFESPVKEKTGTVYALNYLYSPKDQEVGFWIGFHGWSRSGGRRGGPAPQIGQWHTTDPKIWVNEQEIAPPTWKQPGLERATPEIPFIDEDYFYREPKKINLKKGWNKFLLKIPHGGTSWKWMFTCVPVEVDGSDVREVEGLKWKVGMQ